MNTLKKIKELEEILEDSKIIPITKHLIVDPNVILPMMEDISESYLQDLKKAREIVKEREEIITRANREADDIIENARKEATRMTMDTEICKNAEKMADQIHDEAYKDALELTEKADIYSEEILQIFEDYLTKCLNENRKTKGEIINKRIARQK